MKETIYTTTNVLMTLILLQGNKRLSKRYQRLKKVNFPLNSVLKHEYVCLRLRKKKYEVAT